MIKLNLDWLQNLKITDFSDNLTIYPWLEEKTYSLIPMTPILPDIEFELDLDLDLYFPFVFDYYSDDYSFSNYEFHDLLQDGQFSYEFLKLWLAFRDRFYNPFFDLGFDPANQELVESLLTIFYYEQLWMFKNELFRMQFSLSLSESELNTNLLDWPDLHPILIFVVVAVVLALLILGASIFFAVQKPDVEKLSIYECGFDPYEDSRNKFDIRFYIIAILFIIFDLETVFCFPWIMSVGVSDPLAFWAMMDFLIELIVGFVYVWCAGALVWE